MIICMELTAKRLFRNTAVGYSCSVHPLCNHKIASVVVNVMSQDGQFLVLKFVVEVFEKCRLTKHVAQSESPYIQTASLGGNEQLNAKDSTKVLLAAFCTEKFYIDVCGNGSNSCLKQTNRGCNIYVERKRTATHSSFVTVK